MIQVKDYQEGQIELPIYDASLFTAGQMLKWGVDGGTYAGSPANALVDAAATSVDIFAVLQDYPGSTLIGTNRNTPTIRKGRVSLVDNVKIYKVYYDLATANDLDITSSTSTVVTHAASDDDLDGSWIYINSGTGAGQLRYVSAANTTTKTVNTAFSTTPDSTSDFILIRPEGICTGGNALDTTFSLMRSILDGTNTSEIIVLKNFMEGAGGSWELDITQNPQCEQDGLNSRGVRFYSHIIFADTILHAKG